MFIIFTASVRNIMDTPSYTNILLMALAAHTHEAGELSRLEVRLNKVKSLRFRAGTRTFVISKRIIVIINYRNFIAVNKITYTTYCNYIKLQRYIT
jgi:hypothetical protein